MIERRDLLLGGVCAGAVGVAEWLRPRQEMRLLPSGQRLSNVVPTAIPGWSAAAGGDIVIPRTEGSLASRLYDDELARNYRASNATSDSPPIMLLIAYGSNQSDSLQLHRPEACYPAVGFEVTPTRLLNLPLGARHVLPAVALTATLESRIEDIVYFTRVGESLPRTEGEQRRDRLQAAMAGTVGDGLLLRASSIRDDSGEDRFSQVQDFLIILLRAMSSAQRIVLLGRRFAQLG
jgi:EpsI family protein